MKIVAEIGLNYDGNINLAYEMIKQAKKAGADIAKFQFGWRCNPGEINFIDSDIAHKLRSWCDFFEIEMLASIINEEALDLARDIDLDRYKIASRTVIDKPELCRRVLAEGKETFVSLGMWNNEGFPFGNPHEKLRYIYCHSKYPAYPEDLKGFPQKFDESGYYGYSDHLHGIEASILAISRGARYIENHFTLNKTSQVIRDHILSVDPAELRQLVETGRTLSKMAAYADDK